MTLYDIYLLKNIWAYNFVGAMVRYAAYNNVHECFFKKLNVTRLPTIWTIFDVFSFFFIY